MCSRVHKTWRYGPISTTFVDFNNCPGNEYNGDNLYALCDSYFVVKVNFMNHQMNSTNHTNKELDQRDTKCPTY